MKLKPTLRDLFWLVLLAAMGCAWWLDHSHQGKQAQKWESRANDLAHWIGRHHFAVEIDWDDDGATVNGLPTIGGY